MKINVKLLAFLIIPQFLTGSAYAQNHKESLDFKNWPKGYSPNEVGNLVTTHFIATPHTNFNRPTPPKVITYPETCTWYGALTFARESKNNELSKKLKQRFEPLFGVESSMIPNPENVDWTVFGAIPLELYIETKEQPYLDLGKQFADKQWSKPENIDLKPEILKFLDNGLTWQTRLWIDDMFMITAVQVQAYRATNDPKYINRAAKEMVVYLDSLQRPNGLFFHAPDVPYFWGRGNGWMAAGMSELLRSLPKNNPDRLRIMKGYMIMMESLLKYQSTNGMWRQLIDDPESWEETSGTGMFAFAVITGVKEGWLDKKIYTPVARKAWLALVSCINETGDIRDVCEGTNKKNDRNYYLTRKRIVGDLHGQAPVLWCASALLR